MNGTRHEVVSGKSWGHDGVSREENRGKSQSPTASDELVLVAYFATHPQDRAASDETPTTRIALIAGA